MASLDHEGITFAVFFTALLGIASCCSDVGHISLKDEVHHAAIVAYGKVRSKFPEKNLDPSEFPDRFAVQFQVYCTYKGGPLPKIINITGGGHVPGLCHSTRLNVDKKYIVLMRKTQRGFEPSAGDIEVSSQNANGLKNITKFCGLELHYPSGTVNALNVKCEAPKLKPRCVLYTPNNGKSTPNLGKSLEKTTKPTSRGTSMMSTHAYFTTTILANLFTTLIIFV